MEKLSYGTIEIDFDTLPSASQRALAQRGLTHFLGNEQASKLAAWSKAEGQANSEDKATVLAWKEANSAAVTSKMGELVAEANAALLAGTVGVRTSGPRVEPIDAVKTRLAKDEVLTILRNAKIAIPKKDEAVQFADGRTKSLAQMVTDRLAHAEHGPRITKAAEKILRDKAKAAEALGDGVADL